MTDVEKRLVCIAARHQLPEVDAGLLRDLLFTAGDAEYVEITQEALAKPPLGRSVRSVRRRSQRLEADGWIWREAPRRRRHPDGSWTSSPYRYRFRTVVERDAWLAENELAEQDEESAIEVSLSGQIVRIGFPEEEEKSKEEAIEEATRALAKWLPTLPPERPNMDEDEALRRRALSIEELAEHQRLMEANSDCDRLRGLERKINKLFIEEMKEQDRQDRRRPRNARA